MSAYSNNDVPRGALRPIADLLYICVICAAPLKHEHQVCCHRCYAQLVKRWMEALS